MVSSKDVLLLGERITLSGDEHDLYFGSFAPNVELADSVITAVLQFIPNDPVCLDIGANLGLYAMAIGRRFPSATVIACEPVPRTFECLSVNLATNAPSATALQIAVGAEPGTAHMNFAEHYAAGSHLSVDGSLVSIENMGDTDVEVQIQTVDDIVANQDLLRVDLIKIDVEGFELDVLSGAEKTFASDQPIVQLEFNSWAFATHRKQLPQDALEQIMTTFPFVYVHDRHSDRFARIIGDIDKLSLLRANMLHGCVDNLMCAFTELVPDAPAYAAVWEEFSVTPDFQFGRFQQMIDGLRAEIGVLKARNDDLAADSVAVRQTLSWRITKPLRAIRRLTS